MSGGDVQVDQLTILAFDGDDWLRLTNGDGRTLTLGALPTLNGEHLDAGTADLRLTGVTASDVERLLASARNVADRWSGPGIGTSADTKYTGLAAMQQDADVLVKFTYDGDVNQDGWVNADHYFRIDSSFLAQPPGPPISRATPTSMTR